MKEFEEKVKKIPTEAYIDIENAHTQKVITIDVPIIEYDDIGICVFDISNITDEELLKLQDAINPELDYTDIEMFFVDTEPGIPNFGPDFDYEIINGHLIAKYTRNIKRGGKER